MKLKSTFVTYFIVANTTNNGLRIHYMDDIEKCGSMRKYAYVDTEPDDCVTIIYTSGSSGFLKGAIISQSAFRATFPRWCLPCSNERVALSYRPMAWAADRDAVIATFLSGGRSGFSTGDPSRLMEELALIRPSYFGGPQPGQHMKREKKSDRGFFLSFCGDECNYVEKNTPFLRAG
jgi:long-subunit acyl-CoA synthetase (AMP-forming)